MRIHGTSNDFACVIYGKDVYGSEPVTGEAVKPGKQAIAASADVTASADGSTGSARDGYTVTFVELAVYVPKSGAGLDAVSLIALRDGRSTEKTQVDNGAAGVADSEVLITVSSAANGGTHTRVDDLL